MSLNLNFFHQRAGTPWRSTSLSFKIWTIWAWTTNLGRSLTECLHKKPVQLDSTNEHVMFSIILMLLVYKFHTTRSVFTSSGGEAEPGKKCLYLTVFS